MRVGIGAYETASEEGIAFEEAEEIREETQSGLQERGMEGEVYVKRYFSPEINLG